MDTKTIDLVARAIKRTKPQPEDFRSTNGYMSGLAQWKADARGIASAIADKQKDFAYYKDFLKRCGYE